VSGEAILAPGADSQGTQRMRASMNILAEPSKKTLMNVFRRKRPRVHLLRRKMTTMSQL
jgi:hypothetical protein